jgi:hypothetical protein
MKLFDYLKDLKFETELYYGITTDHKILKINDLINNDISFISVKSNLKDLKDLLSRVGVFLDISDSKESSILSKEFENKKEIKINLMTKDNYVRLFFPFQSNINDPEKEKLIKEKKKKLIEGLKNYSFIAFFDDKELDQEQSDFIRLSLGTIRGTNRNRVISTI